jgi:hypothetical protein
MAKLNIKFISDRKRIEDDLHFFLFTDNPFKEEFLGQIAEYHPELHKDLAGKGDEEGKEILNKYLTKFYQAHQDQLEQSVDNVEKIWRPIEEKVGEALSEQFSNDWEGISDLTAVVGVTEVCPRDLDAKIFQFFYLQYPFQALATTLHEITHFIYFKKWAELFPEDHKDTREAPHKYWHLSEILVSVFNNDEKVRGLIPDADVYGDPTYRNKPSESELMDMSVRGYFEKKYLEFKSEGKSIEDYLKFCRGEIEKFDFKN